MERHIPRFAKFDRWRGKRELEIECGISTGAINFARQGGREKTRSGSRAARRIRNNEAAELHHLRGGNTWTGIKTGFL